MADLSQPPVEFAHISRYKNAPVATLGGRTEVSATDSLRRFLAAWLACCINNCFVAWLQAKRRAPKRDHPLITP
jgi:hypothetical protein